MEFIPAVCQWIGSEPRSDGEPVCSNAVLPDKSYCYHHYYIVYQMGTTIQHRLRALEYKAFAEEHGDVIDNDFVDDDVVDDDVVDLEEV